MTDQKLEYTLDKIANLLSRLDNAMGGQENSQLFLPVEKKLSDIQDLGPLNELLADDSVNDILINGHQNIFIERFGKLERTNLTLPNDAALQKIAVQIAEAVGRKFDPRRPVVDARLLDGSRVNIIAPPLAVDGTTISIRKFSKKLITLENMADAGNVSKALAEILGICGGSRLNILISGGTGAGKTTLLNAIAQEMGDSERIVTIEDSAELRIGKPHIVRLETKPLDMNRSKQEEVSIRDLVKNALRMRPDRIIVGEVRGAEAFDMMQAMNTGHEGSMTTIHANHPRDALARLENMVMMTDLGLPSKAIRTQIASAVNIIVQISRMRDGHRRITQVTEVAGMEGEVITMQDIFTFVPDGTVDKNGRINGRFKWSGIVPRFTRRIAYWGYQDRLSKALGIDLPKM